MKKRFTNYRSEQFWQIEVTGNSLVTTAGRISTLGKVVRSNFANEKDCLKEAAQLMVETKKKGYHESIQKFCDTAAIQDEFQNVSSKRKTITGEGRSIVLFAKHDISAITVLVKINNDTDTRKRKSEDTGDGAYCSMAYALGSELKQEGDPGNYLVWLSGLNVYGSWDRRQKQLVIFPGVSWKEIEGNPFRYFKSDSRENEFPAIQDYLNLKDHFIFIPSRLEDEVHLILEHPDHLRRAEVEAFLTKYESRLLCLPFCIEVENSFKALVTLYYHIGQWLEGDSEYAEAIEWFEKSLQLLNQSARLRVLFSDIYLQLSFCYLETSKFDLALLYIDIFALYDISSREACARIKDSICRTQQLYKDAMNALLKDIEQASGNGHEEASSMIRRAIASAPNDPIIHFNLACFFSASNRVKDALYHLEEAFKKGYRNDEKVRGDADLENVRHTTEFEDIRLKYLFITG